MVQLWRDQRVRFDQGFSRAPQAARHAVVPASGNIFARIHAEQPVAGEV
jgi:hypothetical protein